MLVIIIVVIFALLLVGVFFLGKSGTFNSKPSPQQEKSYNENKFSMGQNAYLPVSTWGQFKPNDAKNPYSGSCLNYTAPSNTLSLGFPSIDSLNNIIGPNWIKSTQECVDPDQILAQAGTHTCQNPNNGGGGTGCITSTSFTFNGTNYVNGDFVPVGVTEGLTSPTATISNPYYVSCGSKACPGEIGLIVPNFTNIVNPQFTLSTKPTSIDPNSNYPNCLQNNGINEPNTGAFYTGILPCDLSDSSQVFRTIRYTFDDNYVSSINPVGIYAAIIHRATGFYLAPDMTYLQSINPVTGEFIPNSYTYYFDSLIVNKDPIDSTNQYVNLILINPKYDTVRNGIYWLLQNQTPDATKPLAAIDPGNSINCNNSLVYPVNSGVEVPSNCLDTGVPPWYNRCNPTANGSCGTLNTDTYIPYSPQQFVYIPNIYLVPKDTTDLVEYWTYLTNQFTIQIGSVNELNSNDWRAVDDAYKGIWSLTIAYSFSDIVYYQGAIPGDEGFYVSINAGDNLGNDPSTSTFDWKPVVFDNTVSPTPSPSKVLPLIQNYKGNWSGNGSVDSTTYAGPNILPNQINNTGDVVTYEVGGAKYTYIALQNTTIPALTSAVPPSIPPPGTVDPAVLPAYPPINSAPTYYWQQVSSYSTTPSSYIIGQLFSSNTGTCYVYIGDNSSSTVALPNLYSLVENIPMLKKFLTKIPADVYNYSNQHSGATSILYSNPFYGSDGPNTNITLTGAFSPNTALGPLNIPFMNFIPDVIYGQYYSGGTNQIIAAIVPKLTTSITIDPTTYPDHSPSTLPPPLVAPPVPFNDTTKLLDSQFIGATNLTLQFQSPVSIFRDPISFNYSKYNPFNTLLQ